MKVSTTLNNGKKVCYDVIFNCRYNNNFYLVYTDNTYDKDGRLRLYACLYDDKYNYLRELNDKSEWDIVSNILIKI